MKRLALILPFAALAAFSLAQAGPFEKHVGKPLPAFSATSTTGGKVTNVSLKGKVVLLDFWATWCGPCKLASPMMQKLHTTYGGGGLQVIGADNGEFKKNTAAPYAKAHGYTYTFTEGNDKLVKDLGILGIPAFVLVDKAGTIRRVWTGLPAGGPSKLYTEIEAQVKPLLKG